MKFNASMIQTWMGCPLQARFKEIEKRPWRQNAKASFGTCIHDALELYNRTGRVDLARARFKETWENPELLDVAPETWPKNTTYGGLRKRGHEILKEYDSKNKWENRKIVATEHKFCVPFGEHDISGIVDLVEVKKSARGRKVLRVVDYKTNSRAPNLLQLRMNIQFTVYCYATMQREFWTGNGECYPPLPDGEAKFEEFQDYLRRPIWYHLWGNKEIDAGERDDQDFMRLYTVCCEIAKACDLNVFVPNISGSTCTFCDYTDLCPSVIPIRDRLDVKIGEDEDDEAMF